MKSFDPQDISNLIRIVQVRQRITNALNVLFVTGCWLGVSALILSLVDRIGADSWVPWSVVIVVCVFALLGAGVIGFLTYQPDVLDTAREVDGRLGLKDRLSTAIACRGNKDPFSLAAIDDACRIAGLTQTRESARRRFPIRIPSLWWASPLLLLMVIVITMFGQWDLVSSEVDEQQVNLVEVRKQASESVTATMDAIKQDPMLSEAMQEALDKVDSQTSASLEGKDDEESIRREALKRVTVLNQQLEQIVEGPKGQAMEEIEKSLGSLESPDDSSVAKIVDALSKSRFDQAGEEFSKLEQKIDSGEMDAAEREQVIDDLEKLAEQLDDLSSEKQSMKDALRQAGLDPDLTNDSDAMQEAIEQSDQLNESQKESLREMADSKEQASKMLKELSQATENISEECQSQDDKSQDGKSKDGQSQDGKSKDGQSQNGKSQEDKPQDDKSKDGQSQEGKSQDGKSEPKSSKAPKGQSQQALDQMAKLKKMLEQAKSAQKSCDSQCQKLGTGLASQKACNKSGQGIDGKGRSSKAQETATGFVKKNDAGKSGEGPIVSRTKVDRQLDVGESRMTLRQAQQAAREGFDEAMEENVLPRQYHDALKHYFADPKAVEQAVKSDADKERSETKQEQSDGANEQGAVQEAKKED